MQELWSSSRKDIYWELKKIASENLPVSLHGTEGHLATSRLLTLVHREGKIFLVLQRPRSLAIINLVQKVVYKRLGRPFMYFPVTVDNANERFLSCGLPRQLYYLQRRHFPRYRIKNRGKVAFFMNRRARVCQMDLEDLSLGGAKLTGSPRYDLHKTETLGPATFTLVSDDELVVREVTINQATVVRSIVEEGANWDVGVRFRMSAAERNSLAHLLSDSFARQIFQ